MRQYSTPKRSVKSLGGLAAKQNGADAESQVEQMAAVYQREYVAEVCKRYEPYRRLGGTAAGGAFRATYLGKSGCDFELWLSDGRAGHLEMKSREGERIEKSAIDDEQKAQLHRRLAWNQLALVLVRLQGDWFLISFSNWNNGDRKSHNRLQLEEIGARVPQREGLPDFLAALPQALAKANPFKMC